MSNVLDNDKQQQIRALGRLGWTLRRIQQATGVRRETVSGYLKAAGIAVRAAAGRANQKQNRPFPRRCPPTSGQNRQLRARGCPPTPCVRHRRAEPRARAPASRIARSSPRRSRVAATPWRSGRTWSTTTAFPRATRVSAASSWPCAAARRRTRASSSRRRRAKKARSTTARARWSATAAPASTDARGSLS